MKNNLILGIQALMKVLTGTIFVVALIATNFAYTRDTVPAGTKGSTAQPSPKRLRTGVAKKSSVRLKQSSVVPRQTSSTLIPSAPPVETQNLQLMQSQGSTQTGALAMGQQPAQSQTSSASVMTPEQIASEIQRLNDGVRWVEGQSEWPTQYVNSIWSHPSISDDHINRLRNRYNTLMAGKASAFKPYIPSDKGQAAEESQEAKPGIISQAWEGTKERVAGTVGWGWQKGKDALGYASSVPSAVLGYDYDSSLGTGTKLAGGAGLAAAVPYLGVAAATGGTAVAAGAVGYGALSLIDRLEFRYQSKHWTREGALSFEKMRLTELLSDSGKYPTPTIKINALDDAVLETSTEASLDGDQYKISFDARKALKQGLVNQLNGDPVLKEFDNEINSEIGTIRYKR